VTFSSLATFTAAAPGLPVETFESGLVGAGALTSCAGPLSSAAASACFPAGGLLPGVVYSATGSPTLVVLGAGFLTLGNTSKVLGPNAGASTLTLAFTGVTAVGFDVFPGLTAGNIDIEIFSLTDVSLGSFTIPGVLGGSFFGVTSTSDQIGRVTVNSLGTPGELIDNLRFGASTTVPEPSSLILLAAGLSLVFRLRKRVLVS